MPEQQEKMSISQAANYLLLECRMVLPGIQALFGFQLVAVFNTRFTELNAQEQRIHLLALALVAIAVAIIMTPAALHRASGTTHINETFLRVSSRLLLWSMLPLATSICLDFYLIGRLVMGESILLPLVATLLFALFIVLWFILPKARHFQNLLARR